MDSPAATGSRENDAPPLRRSAAAPPSAREEHGDLIAALERHDPAHPLLLTGVTLHDGTGAEPVHADVLLHEGRVRRITAAAREAAAVATGENGAPVADATRIDATGLVLLPGMVDIHTHSDLTLLSDPLGHSKLLQGVTCEIVGNCGLGMSPRGITPLPELRGVGSYLDRDPAVLADFPQLADYLQALSAARPALHVGTLVAHIPLHAAVTGLGDRPSTPEQVARIAQLAREAIAQGALGISTGLVYAPLCFVAEDELVALGQVAAETDTVLAWHVRDYIDDLMPSIEQALRVAEATGCRTQISHLQAVGRRNWEAMDAALARIDACRARGLDIGVDIYPYLAGNAPLSQLLPPWVQAGGDAALRKRLADPVLRARVHEEMTAPPGNAVRDDEIVVSACPDPSSTGLTLAQLAPDDGDGTDAALDLLARFGTAVQMVAYGRSAEVLERVLDHPACVVASDGLAMDPDGPSGRDSTHPRSYGTFPRYLSEHDRTLSDAVRRCTSAPADRLGLCDHGRIAVGARADLVLADPHTLADRATYTEPHRHPGGILAVFVSGRVAALDGAVTGVRAGTVLHGPR